jgi:hypothetical protein
VVGGRADKFYENALGITSGQITEQVTGRFFYWEMLLAFKLTDSQFKALPRDEQTEMRMFWQWRNERTRQMQEEAEMKRRGPSGLG